MKLPRGFLRELPNRVSWNIKVTFEFLKDLFISLSMTRKSQEKKNKVIKFVAKQKDLSNLWHTYIMALKHLPKQVGMLITMVEMEIPKGLCCC